MTSRKQANYVWRLARQQMVVFPFGWVELADPGVQLLSQQVVLTLALLPLIVQAHIVSFSLQTDKIAQTLPLWRIVSVEVVCKQPLLEQPQYAVGWKFL